MSIYKLIQRVERLTKADNGEYERQYVRIPLDLKNNPFAVRNILDGRPRPATMKVHPEDVQALLNDPDTMVNVWWQLYSHGVLSKQQKLQLYSQTRTPDIVRALEQEGIPQEYKNEILKNGTQSAVYNIATGHSDLLDAQDLLNLVFRVKDRKDLDTSDQYAIVRHPKFKSEHANEALQFFSPDPCWEIINNKHEDGMERLDVSNAIKNPHTRVRAWAIDEGAEVTPEYIQRVVADPNITPETRAIVERIEDPRLIRAVIQKAEKEAPDSVEREQLIESLTDDYYREGEKQKKVAWEQNNIDALANAAMGTDSPNARHRATIMNLSPELFRTLLHDKKISGDIKSDLVANQSELSMRFANDLAELAKEDYSGGSAARAFVQNNLAALPVDLQTQFFENAKAWAAKEGPAFKRGVLLPFIRGASNNPAVLNSIIRDPDVFGGDTMSYSTIRAELFISPAVSQEYRKALWDKMPEDERAQAARSARTQFNLLHPSIGYVPPDPNAPPQSVFDWNGDMWKYMVDHPGLKGGARVLRELADVAPSSVTPQIYDKVKHDVAALESLAKNRQAGIPVLTALAGDKRFAVYRAALSNEVLPESMIDGILEAHPRKGTQEFHSAIRSAMLSRENSPQAIALATKWIPETDNFIDVITRDDTLQELKDPAILKGINQRVAPDWDAARVGNSRALLVRKLFENPNYTKDLADPLLDSLIRTEDVQPIINALNSDSHLSKNEHPRIDSNRYEKFVKLYEQDKVPEENSNNYSHVLMSHPEFRMSGVLHRWTDPNFLNSLEPNKATEIRQTLLFSENHGNPVVGRLPSSFYESLPMHPYMIDRALGILQNRADKAEWSKLLRRAMEYGTPTVHGKIAEDAKSYELPEFREWATSHPDSRVRANAIENGGLSLDTLKHMAKNDESADNRDLALGALSQHDPDSYNQALDCAHDIEVNPSTEILKHFKGLVQEAGGTVNKQDIKSKKVKGLEGVPSQLFDGKGNITAQAIESHIQGLPKNRYNVSYGEWSGGQQHDDNDQLVVQVNLTNEQANQLKKEGLFDTFQQMYQASLSSGHPVRPHTLGWARIDDTHPEHWHIDEVQSDFGQGSIRQIEEEMENEDVDKEEGYRQVEKIKRISKILAGPFKSINHAIFAVAHAVARNKGVETTSMDKVKDQAEQSNMDPDLPLPGYFQMTYKQLPQSVGYKEGSKQSVMSNHASQWDRAQIRKLVKSLAKVKTFILRLEDE